MPVIDLVLEDKGDGAWPDLFNKPIFLYQGRLRIAILPGGMQSAKPSVSIRLDFPEDFTTNDFSSVVIVETSLALFLQIALAAYTKYGDAGTGLKVTIGG